MGEKRRDSNQIRNEKVDIKTNTDTGILRDSNEQLYDSKLNKFKEIDKFLETQPIKTELGRIRKYEHQLLVRRLN